MNLIAKWKLFVDKMNTKGIPIPVARDPKTGKGSVTLSLVVFSAGLCGVSILMMLGTSVAKLSTNFVLNQETANQIHDAFVSSLEFLVASLGGYLGRKMQKDPNGAVTLEAPEEEK